MRPRIIPLLLGAVLASSALSSCAFDDSDILARLEALEKKVTALESAAAAGDYITDIKPILDESSVVIGYTISFQNAQPINVYYGKDGEDGAKGDKGDKGDTGEKGDKGDKGDAGAQGDSYFQSIEITDTYVVFVTSDGKTVVVPRVVEKEYDTILQIAAKGDGEIFKFTVPEGKTLTSKPEWVNVTIDGEALTVSFSENTDELNARMGKIVLSTGDEEQVIPVAQAAKGCLCFYESFQTTALANAWSGAVAPVLNGDSMTLGGGDNYLEHVQPLFAPVKIRQKYDDSNCNKFICTLDIKADAGCAGIIAFNGAGYQGSYDLTSTQNYLAFASANAPDNSGGYFCFHVNNEKNFEANAMDNWSGDLSSGWFRLEVSNVARNDSGVEGNWGGKYIWGVDADAQPTSLLLSGAMWWWNDSPQLGTEYGYFGIFAKETSSITVRNFVISYTDK